MDLNRIGIAFALMLTLGSTPAWSSTITFEEAGLPFPGPSGSAVSQVGDLGFTGLRIVDASNLFGHINLSQSFPNAADFGPNDVLSATLIAGRRFDFLSAYFGSTHGSSFSLTGWRDGVSIFSATAASPQFTPLLFQADWTSIDKLTIQSAYFLSGYNMMDNLSYSTAPVPEPSILFLMLAGVGLIGIACRKRSIRDGNSRTSCCPPG
jgi:hypothetical protein